MIDKIKITEKEFFDKMCKGCYEPKGKNCAIWEKTKSCSYKKVLDNFDVFEIVPDELITLEKIDRTFDTVNVYFDNKGIPVVSYGAYLKMYNLFCALYRETVSQNNITALKKD
jgi:hypothetical protein